MGNKVDFSFFIDNKNELKTGSFEAALAAMLHPENKNITIIQPQMSIEDPVYEGNYITSAFLRMMRIARDVHNDRYLATLHGLYNNMSAYYGKGMLRLDQYDYMVMNEILNLKYIDSHDWQESVFNHAALAISGDTKTNVMRQPASGCDSRYSVLMEKGHESISGHAFVPGRQLYHRLSRRGYPGHPNCGRRHRSGKNHTSPGLP